MSETQQEGWKQAGSAALAEALQRYEIAAASWRMERDRLVAVWRDLIHEAMMATPNIDTALLHRVMGNMDNFLNRKK